MRALLCAAALAVQHDTASYADTPCLHATPGDAYCSTPAAEGGGGAQADGSCCACPKCEAPAASLLQEEGGPSWLDRVRDTITDIPKNILYNPATGEVGGQVSWTMEKQAREERYHEAARKEAVAERTAARQDEKERTVYAPARQELVREAQREKAREAEARAARQAYGPRTMARGPRYAAAVNPAGSAGGRSYAGSSSSYAAPSSSYRAGVGAGESLYSRGGMSQEYAGSVQRSQLRQEIGAGRVTEEQYVQRAAERHPEIPLGEVRSRVAAAIRP